MSANSSSEASAKSLTLSICRHRIKYASCATEAEDYIVTLQLLLSASDVFLCAFTMHSVDIWGLDLAGARGNLWETYLSWDTILAFPLEASAAYEAATSRILHDMVPSSMPDTCCTLTHALPSMRYCAVTAEKASPPT